MEGLDAKEIVLSFINALNGEDFKTARVCLNDNFSFLGVLGSREGADAYMKDMERMKLKYDIKKTMMDGEDVCVIYEIRFSDQVPSLFTMGWYHLDNGKISILRVVFDPRPVLDQQK